VSTGSDIALLTCMAAFGHGPNSPLVFVYFVIIALSALRFQLPLIWCATLGSMLGYLLLLGLADKTWFDNDHVVPVIEQLVVLLSLAWTGIMVGQVVRRVRALADDYAHRLEAARKQAP
jgi:hypothetical protein